MRRGMCVGSTMSRAFSRSARSRPERTMIHRRSVLKALAALPGFAVPALAQSSPDRSIKLIVPYPAGGSTDVGARVVAEQMAKGLGQAIVIDNRPGAGVGGRSGEETAEIP